MDRVESIVDELNSLVSTALEEPRDIACRAQIEALGEELFKIGGLSLMQDICQRVAETDETQWGRRTDIIDKNWDGVGDAWWA